MGAGTKLLTESSLSSLFPDISAHSALVSGVHKVVARGCLSMSTAAWIGLHPGFINAVTDNGTGDFTVKLSSDGTPATMIARCNPIGAGNIAVQSGPLGGVGNRDLNVRNDTYVGADSSGATLGNYVPKDATVIIEVLDFA